MSFFFSFLVHLNLFTIIMKSLYFSFFVFKEFQSITVFNYHTCSQNYNNPFLLISFSHQNHNKHFFIFIIFPYVVCLISVYELSLICGFLPVIFLECTLFNFLIIYQHELIFIHDHQMALIMKYGTNRYILYWYD